MYSNECWERVTSQLQEEIESIFFGDATLMRFQNDNIENIVVPVKKGRANIDRSYTYIPLFASATSSGYKCSSRISVSQQLQEPGHQKTDEAKMVGAAINKKSTEELKAKRGYTPAGICADFFDR